MSDWDRSGGRPPETASGAAVFLQVLAGVASVFAMHLVVGGLFVLVITVVDAIGTPPDALWGMGMLWLTAIGLAQAPYVIPALVAAAFVRRPLALGIAIGAALTLVLNGTCFALLITTMRH